MRIEELSQQAATRTSGRAALRGGSSSKAAARAALRDAMDAISRTARALALDTPGLDDKFRLPKSQAEPALLNAGRAFAQDAAPPAPLFVAHDLPETFLKDLNGDIKGFEQAIHNHAAGRGSSAAARASFDAAMEAGLTAVQRLDAIVANRLRDDPATLGDVGERAPRRAHDKSRAGRDSVSRHAAAGVGSANRRVRFPGQVIRH